MKTNVIVEGPDKDWQAEQDLRVLVQAAQIHRDKKRLSAAQGLARKRAADLKLLAEDE